MSEREHAVDGGRAGRPAGRRRRPGRRAAALGARCAALLLACTASSPPSATGPGAMHAQRGLPAPGAAPAAAVAAAPGMPAAVAAQDAPARVAARHAAAASVARTPLEEYARALVDHPLMARGDLDGIARVWIELVEREPDHPLADATLTLLAALRPRLADPRALTERLAALDPQRAWAPAARRTLLLTQGLLRTLYAPVHELGQDAFPDFHRAFAVLGPLPPLGHPGALLDGAGLLRDPGLDRAHAGAFGEVRWQRVERSPTSAAVRPAVHVHPERGWVLLAAEIDGGAGGRAWLEMDAVHGGGAVQSLADRSWGWCLDGGPVHVVDMASAPRAPVEVAEVELRPGRNVLVVRASLDAGPPFELRLRVLRAPPGPDALAFLAALPERGPDTEALLGWLEALAGLDPVGVDRLEQVVAAHPARAGLRALLSQLLATSWHLPAVWSGARARELSQQVLAGDPSHFDAAVHTAQVLLAEDRQEEALALLERGLVEGAPDAWRRRLALRAVYQSLGWDARAEIELLRAAEQAPDSPAVLAELVAHHEAGGRRAVAAELAQQRLRALGATPGELAALAERHAALSRMDSAEALLREAVARTGGEFPGALAQLAAFLLGRGEPERADALFAGLVERFPRWDVALVGRADAAHLAARPDDEARWLAAAVEASPSSRAVRERLAALLDGRAQAGPDAALVTRGARGLAPILADAGATGDLAARFGLDGEAVRAGYDPSAYRDSIVRLIDEALVVVFPDGSFETRTHELFHARDLAAIERQGRVRLAGDVLMVRTIKADGTVYEPIDTGEFVMPNLEPGDFVETITRTRTGPPADGVVRLGRWLFASTEESFHVSRYVVSLPRSLPLRIVTASFDGTHAVHDEGDRLVHVFELRDRARVLTEPGAPPAHWYLPWVEVGADRDPAAVAAALRFAVTPARWLTPALRRAAAAVTAGTGGQEQAARALHRFVDEHLDRRTATAASAHAALLTREGHPALLYSALLRAADVPHDLVFARAFAPDGDPDPRPPFLDADFWSGRLLVRVRPDDGPEAWCGLETRGMPYGALLGNAPGASAIAVDTGELLATPWVPLSERAGERQGRPLQSLQLALEVAPDRSATAELVVRWPGGVGFTLEEWLAEQPRASREAWARIVAGHAMPRLELTDWELLGLDDPDEPLSLRLVGRVPAFIAPDGSASLPLSPSSMGATFAGEGARRLPLFLASPWTHLTHTTLRLPPGLELGWGPGGEEIELPCGRFRLALGRIATTPEGGSVWVIERGVALAPCVVEPDEYAALVEGCARVDELERTKLGFRRVDASAAGGAGDDSEPRDERDASDGGDGDGGGG